VLAVGFDIDDQNLCEKMGRYFFIGSSYGVVKVNPGSFRLHVSVEPRSRSLKGEGCRLGVDE
jgi:hypothetical protein